MADIFISYAREDGSRANLLAKAREEQGYVKRLIAYLEEAGLSVWADNRIDYGEKWWRTIVGNLRSCLAMVVVMSPAAEESKWVDREILLADELEKPFFPLLLMARDFLYL